MRASRRASLAATLGCAIANIIGGTANAAQAREPIVVFMGASETAGYGLPRKDLSFPSIVARRCGIIARVSATPNVPTLLRKLSVTSSTTATVLTLSFIDAYVPAPVGALRRWLRRYTNAAPTLVLTTPLVSAFGTRAPTLLSMQRQLYRRVASAAKTLHATLLPIGMPAHPARYLQRDGIHPNARGARIIAHLVIPLLRSKGLCDRA